MNFLNRLKQKHILLIDDDEWIRDSMGLFFDSEGCRFQAVETAEAGIAELQAQDYDIIISDYRLPGMDGLTFFKQIKATQKAAVKILITAYGDDDLAEESARAGINDYIQKPFDMQDIERALMRLMAARTT